MRITLKCSVTGNTYTGKQVSHIRETPKSSRYWATIFGEWIENKAERPAYNVYIVLASNSYYIVKSN